jgi:hypothetical protein
MYDANGCAIQSGDSVKLTIGYFCAVSAKSYPASSIGVYQNQKVGPGFLIAFVRFGRDILEVNYSDFVFCGTGMRNNFDSADPGVVLPRVTSGLCPRCQMALVWGAGVNDCCPTCKQAARYRRL